MAKGDRIIPGQVIGSVEKSSIDEEKQNYLHFELRKGTESLDPEPLFQWNFLFWKIKDWLRIFLLKTK